LNFKAASICILIATCLLAASISHSQPALATDMPSPAWTTKISMLTATAQAAVITGDNGLIYVIGGYSGSDPPFATVQAYNPTTNTWSYKTSLPQVTRGAAVAKGTNGLIYVIGGYDGSTPYPDTVQAYNTTSNSWSLKQAIPVPVFMASAVTGNDGKIYVFGGYQDSYLNTTQIYNPDANTWTNGTDMPTKRIEACAVKASDGLIYVIGGTPNGTVLSTVDAYNPVTDTWTTKASMSIPRLAFGAVLGPDNKIYVIGGGLYYSNSPPFYDTVEIYDPKTNTWTTPTWTESLLPTARKELGVTLGKNGRIYALGGTNGTYLSTNEEAIIVLPENVVPTAYIDSITPNPAAAGEQITLTGHGTDSDGSIAAYQWRSSLNGTIGTSATLNITLPTGIHNIYFSVKDNSGAWSPEATATLTVTNTTADPLYQKILDLQQQNSGLNDKLNNLQSQYDNLTSKLDTMTYELLGTGIVAIILMIVIIAVIFIPPKRKAQAAPT